MGNYLDGYGKDVCDHCNMTRTKEGHDGCVGTLEGVMNACCGQGENATAYVQFNHQNYGNFPNKHLIRGTEAINYINKHKNLDK